MFKLKFNIFVFFIFLLFPKIAIYDGGVGQTEQGILIGEIFLIISFFINFKDVQKGFYIGSVNHLIFIFYLVIFFYVMYSSIISGFFNGIFPSHAIFYFFRILIYSLLPIVVVVIFRSFKDDYFWYKLIKYSYLMHGVFSLLIYFYYFLKIQPSFNDSLWVADVGYRLVPLVGMAFNPLKEHMFYAIGGGSSNLLGTWSVFFILTVIFLEKSYPKRILYYFFVFLLLILSQSRGGLISFFLTLFVSFFILGKYKIGFFMPFIFIFLLFCSFLYFNLSSTSFEFIPIWSRFFDSFRDGSFDGSTAARFQNYSDMFNVWSSNIVYIISGLGFDENLLFFVSGWTLVESFFLSLLFNGGLLSCFIFLFFVYKIFFRRNYNFWYSILFYFIFLNSLVNWSITGSDILSVVGLFPILFLSKISSLKNNNI